MITYIFCQSRNGNLSAVNKSKKRWIRKINFKIEKDVHLIIKAFFKVKAELDWY